MNNSSFCTPEDLLIVPAAIEGYPINAIECAIGRANAQLIMLMGQFDGQSDAKYADHIICNVLWAIQGEIKILEAMVIHGHETSCKQQ